MKWTIWFWCAYVFFSLRTIIDLLKSQSNSHFIIHTVVKIHYFYKLLPIKTKVVLGDCLCVCAAPKLWNGLPLSTNEAPSFDILKFNWRHDLQPLGYFEHLMTGGILREKSCETTIQNSKRLRRNLWKCRGGGGGLYTKQWTGYASVFIHEIPYPNRPNILRRFFLNK